MAEQRYAYTEIRTRDDVLELFDRYEEELSKKGRVERPARDVLRWFPDGADGRSYEWSITDEEVKGTPVVAMNWTPY